MPDDPTPGFMLYQSPDGTGIRLRLEGQTAWLTQAQMAELFQTTKQNVSLHVQNVFDEGEVEAAATVKDYLTVQQRASARSNAPSSTPGGP